MSHFSVLVIGPEDSIEEQLAPYMENCCGTPDMKYMEFYDTETEYREEWDKNEPVERVVLQNGTYASLHDEQFVTKIESSPRALEDNPELEEVIASLKKLKKCLDDLPEGQTYMDSQYGEIYRIRDSLFSWDIYSLPVGAGIAPVPLQKVYKDFETFVREWHGASERDAGQGRYGYWQNPNAKWDWYLIGGRWTGFFKLKEAAVGAGEVGQPGLMTAPAEEGYCDSARKDDIDFDGMRRIAGEKADAVFTAFEEHIDSSVPFASWDNVREWVMKEGPFVKDHTALLEEEQCRPTGKVGDRIDFDKEAPTVVLPYRDPKGDPITEPINIARELYHSQPWMLDKHRVGEIVRAQRADDGSTASETLETLCWSDLEDFQVGREEYVQRARDRAITTFAVVKDGEWMEKGSMGWWGMVSDEKEQGDWNRQFNDALDALPGHTRLTIVDCHI